MGKQFGLKGYNILISNIKHYYEVSHKEAIAKYKGLRSAGEELGLDKATAINRMNYVLSVKASGNNFRGETDREILIRVRFQSFASKYGLEEQLDSYVRGDIDYSSFVELVEKTKIEQARFIEKYAKGD